MEISKAEDPKMVVRDGRRESEAKEGKKKEGMDVELSFVLLRFVVSR